MSKYITILLIAGTAIYSSLSLSADFSNKFAVYPPGIQVENGVSFADCSTPAAAAAAPEICNKPTNNAWFTGQGSKAEMFVGPPVNLSTRLAVDYWTQKSLACKYCRAGLSNGPLQLTGKSTNVVPKDYSFIVTGRDLGAGDRCRGYLEGLCPENMSMIYPNRFTLEQCETACTAAHQASTIRFVCEFNEVNNFDGDPDCERFGY
jgi:hypothetical protein